MFQIPLFDYWPIVDKVRSNSAKIGILEDGLVKVFYSEDWYDCDFAIYLLIMTIVLELNILFSLMRFLDSSDKK